jgi:GNAT superfamily N-acetyltransferase
MQPLTIRPGQREDIGPLDSLLARSYPRLLAGDYPPSVLVTAIPRISHAQPALVTCGTYFVALRDGVLVGGGGWTRSAPGQRGTGPSHVGHVRHFATDVVAVRLGVGSALMTEVLRTAVGAGIRRLECLSTRTAVPFYLSAGFTSVEAVEVPLAAAITFPAIRMHRKLDP